MATYVIDIEADGLIASKIHVMSVGWKDNEGEWQIKSTDDYDKMIDIVTNPDNVIIGHNFKSFDVVELERVLDVKVEAEIVDTLALAWYILPNRKLPFGLAAFGEDYGVPKPKIDDWEGLTYDEYKHRCEEDVRINILVWEELSAKLMDVYGDADSARKFIRYLMFKMECVAQQRRIGTLIDVDKVLENIDLLEQLRLPKEIMLVEAMPPGSVLKSKPKTMIKKDGSLSKRGEQWYEYLREVDMPLETEEVRADANINSTGQKKDWLFSLGWKPAIFKEGANGKVPQIMTDKKDLCPSILKLADKEPAILALDGLTVINHRLGVLKAFRDTVDEETGYTVASMNGFTNTLRLRHSRPIANLPSVKGGIKKAMENGATKLEALSDNLRDGQLIRECIIAPEGYELCGSDIVSLEDNTKRHYMWDYDPEYVTEQMEEGFDPHLDLALRAGAITEEDVVQHKLYAETGGKEGKSLKEIRDIYKMANYSCIYGVGAPKFSESVGTTVKEAREIIKKYWDRNWAIKQLPKDMVVKTVDEQMWLLNPVNGFWYSIRAEKDIFSTLNQGTGAYVFDCWLKFMMTEDVVPFLQYHDEKLTLVKKVKGARDKHRDIINSSMDKVNDTLQLNVEISVDVQFGKTYADVH